MGRAEQVTHEVIHISSLMTTPITPPGVRIRVKSLVKEVKGLVGICDAAVGAGEPA